MSGNLSVVIRRGSTHIEKFAAEELASYAGAMADKEMDVVNEPSGEAIYVGSLPDGASSGEKERLDDQLTALHQDGFVIRNMANGLVIQGKTPRATLYGVYDYLRMLGARWYFPGKEHEFIPKRQEIVLRNVDLVGSPDFHHRSVVIFSGNSAFQDWIDFAAKAKLSAIHIHSDEGIHQLPDLLSSRGLDFGFRRHFFGGTYSTTDGDDIERNRSLLLDYVRKLPSQLNDLFLWPADMVLELRDGGGLSLPDSVLLFTNEMLKAVRTIRPAARMSFLAYWSTWGVPRDVRPSDGVFLEIAPIHRCFSHSIVHHTCPINSKEVLPVIEDLLRVFDPAEAHVLGYWLDASLFGRSRYQALSGRLPQIGEIARQDVKYYKSKGIYGVSTFAVGLDKEYFSKYASPLLFQYPAALWDVDTDLKSELVRFCENYYGDRSVAQVFQNSEQIEPKDSVKWDALTERFSNAELIVKEILQKTTDDTHILRLHRLIRELRHMNNWADGMSKARPL